MQSPDESCSYAQWTRIGITVKNVARRWEVGFSYYRAMSYRSAQLTAGVLPLSDYALTNNLYTRKVKLNMIDIAMKYLKFVMSVVTILVSGFIASSSLASDAEIRAKFSLGYASYNSPYGSNEIATSYLTQGLGFTYIWPSKVYIDVSTKASGKAATYDAAKVYGGLVSTAQSFSRVENTLTVGKPTESGMQINAGLFTGDTELRLAQFGQFSQKTTGITAGAGRGYPIEEGRLGTVGLSGAVAFLNAKNADRFGTVSNSNLSYGLSIGAVYSYALGKNISVSADAKYQAYFINYSTFSGDEKIQSYSVSLIGQF